MHTLVGSRLGELDELALLWSKDPESFGDHVDVKGWPFRVISVDYHYVLSSWAWFS